jgi:hypothetical protein
VHGDAGALRELAPQQRAEPLDPRLDRVDADTQGIPGGDAQSDLTGDVPLPVLEPARVVPQTD